MATTQTSVGASVHITSPASGSPAYGPTVTISGNATAVRITSGGGGPADDTPLPVTKVEVRLGDGSFTAASPVGSSLTGWTVTLPVPGGQPQRTVTARMTFRTSTSGTATDTRSESIVLTTDGAGPTITITTPQPHALVPLTGQQAGAQKAVPVTGSVTDSQSGVAKVEVAAPGKPFAAAGLIAVKGRWSTTVTITPPLGAQTIRVRATDQRGNESIATVEVDAALQLGSLDPASTADYLGDLLFFADQRITGSITPELLAATFHQRFDTARQPDTAAVATAPVPQARIAVEALRSYLAQRLGASPPPAVTAARDRAERRFLRDTYHAMLRAQGTSDAELRSARAAGEAFRAALAERLGVGSLSVGELDAIALDPDTVSGAVLEQVYGVVDVTRDPYETAAVPVVLDRQLVALRSRWQREDEEAGIALVDPDVLTAGDVVADSNAASLLTARRAQVDAALGALRTQLSQHLAQPGSTHAGVFAALVGGVLGPSASGELDAIVAAARAGADVTARVAALHLDGAGFRRLTAIGALATSAAVREAEWNDVVAVLVGVRKRRDFLATWRQEERAAALVLAPGQFLASARPAPLDGLRDLLASARARLNWEDTLRAREAEEGAVREAFTAAVGDAEAATLRALRDDLIAVAGLAAPTGASGPGLEVVRDRLGDELLLDLGAGATTTTRREQAVDTMQSALFAVRTRRLTTVSPLVGQFPSPAASTWTLELSSGYTESSFDEEWRWMGTFATWRAAMAVFVWPENVLSPTLRATPSTPPLAGQDVAGFSTASFRALAGRLRTTPNLTPVQARAEARTYLNDLRQEFPTQLPAALRDDAAVQITELLTDAQLAERRDKLLATAASAGVPALFAPVTVGGTTFNALFSTTKVWLAEVFMFVPLALAAQLVDSGQHLAAVSWIRTVYAYDFPPDKRRIYRGLVLEDRQDLTSLVRSTSWLLSGLNAHDVAQTRPRSHTRAVILSLARVLLGLADAEFVRETPESLTRARLLYDSVLDLLDRPELAPLVTAQGAQLPQNPVLAAAHGRAEAGLRNLRRGLNALGLERSSSRRPTPFRYATLVDRAGRLAATAQQIEASYLSALEKADAEEYNLLRAEQDIAVSAAGVTLQSLRVEEARSGVVAAELGRSRAVVQRDHLQELVDEGVSGWEQAAVAATLLSAAASLPGIAVSPGAVLGNVLGAAGSAASAKAGFERREQEWRAQLALAAQDLLIVDQQIAQATLHLDVVDQEKQIAEVQLENTRTTLDFLARKFTNAELFDWMSSVLGEVYRTFLQQATVIAQLAEQQLRFERQERLPAFIRADYWEPRNDTAPGGPDRRGMTGAEQLQRDLAQLDQYAFTTDRRRMQLTRTLSLATLDPVAFLRFQQTGLLVFATPTELFDRDFPGHHARLVSRVRTSVVALVPPTEGIRATLTCGATSRVVVLGDGGFDTVVVPHGPESVALSSPRDATGVFELDAQPTLRTPFEGIGVDTIWQLRLPRPANPFDFRTMIDVLLTVDYTALDSAVLRDQVIRSFDTRASVERAFSVRHDFPDQWYDLHNPDQSPTPMRISLGTVRTDFPANLEGLRLEQILLFAAGIDDEPVAVTVEELRLTPTKGEPVSGEGPATAADGLISTRRNNGRPWRTLLRRSPVGEWELALDEELQLAFKEGRVADIVFVISVTGQTAAWPS